MGKTIGSFLSAIALVLALFSITSEGFASTDKNKVNSQILVFAAASMKNALEAIAGEFEEECGCKIVFSFAASGILARQIAAGAPADLYISADTNWMKYLQQQDAVLVGPPTIVARNRLVIAVGKEAALLKPPASVAQILATPRIAMADPQYVPAGSYARQALEKLGLWEKASSRMVFGENVRVSLSLVARGDVGAAMVYQSDAKIEPRVRIAYTFDKGDHPPIIYPASQINRAGGNSALGENFLRFLTSPGAGQIFDKFGFSDAIIVGAND